VGIGINVNHTKFPVDLRDIATSLRIESGTEWSRVELCAALLKSLDREYRAMRGARETRNSILKRFTENSSSVSGRKVRIEDDQRIEGVTEGLDGRGFLQVRTDQGLRTVLSGTVRICDL
jgi:BirA family biotin operon repressor/biotin-[acetyl-CoA-carboxylase] ligase